MQIIDRIGVWDSGNGYIFRVWAPHAQNISVVIQDGPYWENAGDDTVVEKAMIRSGDYWSKTVPQARPWQLYRYRLTFPNGNVVDRLDPAARDILSSELTRNDPSSRNASVIPGINLAAWTPFQTPSFDAFIIYELHVGSFAGRQDHLQKSWSTFQDVESKLSYIKEMGFTCIELMPVHEYARDRSWGYNPASFFAPESSYGSPYNLAHLIDTAHQHGLAVIIDVVYNHAGPGDNALHHFGCPDHESPGLAAHPEGIYFEGDQNTSWGRGPAWWKIEVQDYFYQNARMFIEEYRADGLRFDVTTQINGSNLKQVVDQLRQDFPDKYFIAEHLPANPWIIKTGGFCATWHAESHHECQRALAGQQSMQKIKSILGWDGYDHAWNLVKYTLGSHDDIGDLENGNAENGLTNWDASHRYLIDQLGGRANWTARAKCRLAWALNIAMPGTPMLFMGAECHMASPNVSWGYWHDGADQNGDHRFNWDIAGDLFGIEMRRLVCAANEVRLQNPALREDSLHIVHEDHADQVLAFVRNSFSNTILTIINLGEQDFSNHGYGVSVDTYQGQWTQVLCTQDSAFGGWDGAGNAFYEPWTRPNGQVYLNLPKWSVSIFQRK
ncbi:alpha-amylase family glycosyl hydrolase [Dyadobacter sp. 3J3]|uniref:alpha-amylase family glycosyl hydrolase n=1 Tax=Dyadobacter sp. 3J3 TaxID=2606600 RepID=UPI00135C8973|nr:alpha-amylase family glycosyl hydrolase [Dyadobacter sp. 3J3]